MCSQTQMQLPADLDNIPKFIEFVSFHASQAGFDPDRITEIAVAVEEALVNTIDHGYGQTGGDVTVICLRDDLKRFIIRIEDCAPGFDLVSHENSEPTGPVGEREIGSVGILLIKQLMADVTYERAANKNVLTLLP